MAGPSARRCGHRLRECSRLHDARPRGARPARMPRRDDVFQQRWAYDHRIIHEAEVASVDDRTQGLVLDRCDGERWSPSVVGTHPAFVSIAVVAIRPTRIIAPDEEAAAPVSAAVHRCTVPCATSEAGAATAHMASSAESTTTASTTTSATSSHVGEVEICKG
jgi:hypothetical protein